MPADWFKSSPQDWLDGYERCPSSDHIALYTVVCMRIYQSRGAVPNNPAAFSHFTRKRPDKTAKLIADLVDLELLILVDGGKLHNRRAATELADRDALSAKRAEAGSAGGKSSRSKGELQRNTNGTQGEMQLTSISEVKPDQKMAEKRGSDQAIASTRAREERREEENPPSPPLSSDPPKPAVRYDRIPDNWEEELAERRAANPDRDQQRFERFAKDAEISETHGHSVRDLTTAIMAAARIVAPPYDMPLATGWLAAGMHPDDIMKTVHRMVAYSRGPIRAFRYFDQTLRDEHEQRSHASNAFIEEMRGVARRNGYDPDTGERLTN